MKKLSLFVLIVALTVPGLIAKDYIFSRKEDKAAFYTELCTRYYPVGIQILNYDRGTGYSNIMSYVEGDRLYDLLRSFPTYLHETYHAYESKLAGGYQAKGFLLDEKIQFPIPRTQVFDTREIDRVVPQRIKDRIFRYDPYIIGTRTLASHTQGIYGLMEEWNAYYLESQMLLNLQGYLRGECGTDMECWEEGFLKAGSIFMASEEFRIFIAWYLNRARLHHPEVYEGLMGNRHLRVAFTLLERRFLAVTQAYEKRLQALAVEMTAGNRRAYVEDGFFFIEENRASHGRGVFLPEIEDLRRILNGGLEGELARFRLPHLTDHNWQSQL